MSNLAVPTIDDIEYIEKKGPWTSKSGGSLEVNLALSRSALKKFLDFDNPDFDNIPGDIRGLRTYTVSDIPEGSVGGKEWHKVRTEFLSVLGGRAVLECVDLNGDERLFNLTPGTGVIIPPKILHTYQALEDNTRLQVIANTLFIPEDARTHDTFSVDNFDV